mmetsp:Transcript_816/g.2716  ORF Transcript_816/g.2716 Transcript_816/m.2716 type:complete len:91 (-) Transcript_816:92-364(-)
MLSHGHSLIQISAVQPMFALCLAAFVTVRVRWRPQDDLFDAASSCLVGCDGMSPWAAPNPKGGSSGADPRFVVVAAAPSTTGTTTDIGFT